MGEVLEWVCDLGGEINKGILFIIWKQSLLDCLCIDNWWSHSKDIVYDIT